MRIESEITVDRPREEIYRYLLKAECLPEYVTDFETVEQVSPGDPKTGTEYTYRMRRGAQGSFSWTKLVPNSHLAWSGPAVKAGMGTMQPAGWWDLSDSAGATRVQLVMAPQAGGLLKLLAPFMTAAMRRGNDDALKRLKERLEQT